MFADFPSGPAVFNLTSEMILVNVVLIPLEPFLKLAFSFRSRSFSLTANSKRFFK